MIEETTKRTEQRLADYEKYREAKLSIDRVKEEALRDLGVGDADIQGLYRGLNYVVSQGKAKAQHVLDLFVIDQHITEMCIRECGKGSDDELQEALDNYLRRTKALLDELKD